MFKVDANQALLLIQYAKIDRRGKVQFCAGALHTGRILKAVQRNRQFGRCPDKIFGQTQYPVLSIECLLGLLALIMHFAYYQVPASLEAYV